MIKYHDDCEPACNDVANALGKFVAKLCSGNFPGRKRQFAIIGAPHTGKTTATKPLVSVLPRPVVFTYLLQNCTFLPSKKRTRSNMRFQKRYPFGDKKPFSKVHQHMRFADWSEMAWGSNDPVSLVLQAWEGGNNMECPVMHQECTNLESRFPPGIASGNYSISDLGNIRIPGFAANHLKALLDPVLGRAVTKEWVLPTPKEERFSNLATGRCRKCSQRLLCWLSPEVDAKVQAELESRNE